MTTQPSPIPMPRAGCAFFLLPVLLAVSVMVAYAILFGFGMFGIAAEGARTTMDFETCPEAVPLLRSRVEQMGLGDPVWTERPGGITLTATLPDNAAAPHIPATLARTAAFTVRAGPDLGDPVIVDHTGVMKSEFSLKELGNPLVVVVLTRDAHKALEAHMEAHVQDSISVWLDDETLFRRPNDPPFRRQEMDLRAEGEDGIDNLRRAADWGLLMTNGPLPCPATVTSAPYSGTSP